MNIASSKPIKAMRSSRAGRAVLAALLCAFGAAALAGSALAATGNLVKNGSFEKDGNGDGIPNAWSGSALTSGDKRVCNQSQAGACSFKMVAASPYAFKNLNQCIGLTGTNAGDEYNFRAWTKGKGLDLAGGEATLYVDFYDGGIIIDSDYYSLPAGTSPWTLRQIPATAAADYDAICIALALDANAGKIWFDKVSLVYVP